MEWKVISEIPGFEDYTNYELNIAGDLRNRKTGRLLKWCGNGAGYLNAQLSQNNIPKYIQKHVAICRLFLPNPENKPCVDHIIRDKNNLDNSISNLRWATYAENNHNRSLSSRNTSGEQHICPTFNNGSPIWRIQIVAHGEYHIKLFSRDPNSDVIPWQVIQWRDWMKLYHHPSAPTSVCS